MANKKISELTAASSVATSDVLPIVQGGVTKQATVTQVLANATSAAATITSVAYAATVTPATNAGGDILNIGALTGNITLGAPTGSPIDGQKLQIRWAQDATGTRTVTRNAAYVFGTDITAAMTPTAANATWEELYQYHAASSKWRCLAMPRGPWA